MSEQPSMAPFAPSRVITYRAALPADLGWDDENYDLGAILIQADILRGRNIGSVSLSPEALFPSYKSRPTYWVDPAKVSSGNGSSEANAFRSISEAVTAANTGAVAARIRVKAGTLVRSRNFTASGSVFASVDIVYEAYGGRVVSGAHEALTWTTDGTYTHLFKATRSNCSRVVDLKNVDQDGLYVDLIKVADAAAVDITPGSWAEVSGTVYVRRLDGATVADANTRVYVATENFRLQGTTQVSAFLVGETDADGFDLEGGQSGALRILYTGGAGGARRVVAARNCTFRYSGHSSGAVGNVAVEGLNGLAFFVNCDASGGATDCWNWHNALGASMYVVTVNCVGTGAGRVPGYVSCNGWTGHDTVIGVDICGVYSRNKGVSAHWIGASKAAMVGSRCAASLGDRAGGGSNSPTEFKAEDTAEFWLDMCRSEPALGGGIDMLTSGSGRIHTRAMPNYPLKVEAAVPGSIDAY